MLFIVDVYFLLSEHCVNVCIVSSNNAAHVRLLQVCFMLKASVKDPSSRIQRVKVSGLIIIMISF